MTLQFLLQASPTERGGDISSMTRSVSASNACFSPTVQPLRVVQPDAVCEVGGSTPELSYGDRGIFLGGGQTENLYTS